MSVKMVVHLKPPAGCGAGIMKILGIILGLAGVCNSWPVHAETREDAIRRMSRALDEYIIEGIKTTIFFHKRIMANKDFIEGNIDTSFLERIVLE